MSFARRTRLYNMQREKTGVELLLSEPEIVAWFNDLPTAPRHMDTRRTGHTGRDWRAGRPGEVRQSVQTAVARRSRMLV